MANPATSASMPQFTQLGYNCEIAFEAIDPTTGAAVSGVTVSAAEMWADFTTPDTATSLTVPNPILLRTVVAG